MPFGFDSPLKVYPRNNELDAEIDFVEGKTCRFSFLHDWRTVERWKFPYAEPRPTTQICRRCGALNRLLVMKDQEGEVVNSSWEILGVVTDRWRDYDPYGYDIEKIGMK